MDRKTNVTELNGGNSFLKKFKLRRSIRYEIAFLTSLGFLISFGLRCNMGVSVTYFTHKQTNLSNNKTLISTINWSPRIIGIVDSSFFWGYILTQIPGGYLSSKYPSNHVFGLGLGISSILNLFIPVSINIHFSLVILLRFIQGLCEGVTYPAAHGIWRWWAPRLERTTLSTITFTGSYLGVAVGIPLSGLIAEHFSWHVSFYAFGLVGILWFIVWSFMSHERPAIHPSIRVHERLLIEESLAESSSINNKIWISPPWLSLLTSMPVWAIVVANFCRSWSFYLFIDNQAKYFVEDLNITVGKNAISSALPHIVMSIVVPIGGRLADYLRSHYLSTTIVRKLMNCGGFGIEAIFLIVVAFVKDPPAAITLLTIAVGFSGFAISGFNVNHLDIAPRYASILMGISNGIGTFAAILCPIVVQLLAPTGTHIQWTRIFLLAACIHIFGVIFYGIFASGEEQSWANSCETLKDEEQRILSYGSTEQKSMN